MPVRRAIWKSSWRRWRGCGKKRGEGKGMKEMTRFWSVVRNEERRMQLGVDTPARELGITTQ